MNNIGFENVEQTVKAMKENPELAMKNWFAHVTWKNGIQNEASIRNYSFLMDEPVPLGGTDTAPNPVEYLIAAAVSCFAITFEVMVSQQGIKIEKVEADIQADLNAAVFLGLQEGNGGILNPVIKLKAVTSAPQEQIKEIAKAALAKSPVLASLNTQVELICC